MKMSKVKVWISAISLVILLIFFSFFGFVQWFDHPVIRVNAVTGLGLPFWETDVIYMEDNSNPFGTATQFILVVGPEAYKKSVEYCRTANSYDRPVGFSSSYQGFLREVMPENWGEQNIEMPVDCSFSANDKRVFWRLTLKAPYVFYTLAIT